MRNRFLLVLTVAGLGLSSPLTAAGPSVTVSFDSSKAGAAVGKAIAEGKDPFTYLTPNFADARKSGEMIKPTYDLSEAMVERIDGTIMVKHADNSKPTALQTFSTIQKGDVLYAYDKSWVILKDHKGDHIGLDGGTVVIVDEFYIKGPDRQVRFLLEKGTLFLKTGGSGSRQSFFEINSGSVVSAIDEVRAILTYDPAKEHLRAQHLDGKLTVIDKDNEQKFTVNHTEHNWDNGKLAEDEAIPVDELDVVNFNRFFNAEPRLEPQDNNLLLK